MTVAASAHTARSANFLAKKVNGLRSTSTPFIYLLPIFAAAARAALFRRTLAGTFSFSFTFALYGSYLGLLRVRAANRETCCS